MTKNASLNMNYDPVQYKQRSRRINDIWAFILYVVCMAGVIFYIFNYLKIRTYMETLNRIDVRLLGITAIHGIVTTAIYFLTMIWYPEVTMHVACLSYPIILIGVVIYCGKLLFLIESSIFSVIIIGLYFFYLRHHIKYAAQVSKSSARILLNNFSNIFIYLIITTTLWLAIVYLYITVIFASNYPKATTAILYAGEVFSTSWTCFVLFYFLRVIISSIIFTEYLFEACHQHRSSLVHLRIPCWLLDRCVLVRLLWQW